MRKSIELEVAEADNKDVDEEIVRIYRPARRVIGITNDEMLKHPLVTIKNPKKNRKITVKISVALDTQKDPSKVFMNWMIRARLGVELGERVIVYKATSIESLKYRFSHFGDSFFFGVIFALVILGADFLRYITSVLLPSVSPMYITLIGDIASLIIWILAYFGTKVIKS
ncbi:MAG: hypothetical protein ACP6IS_00670 [Candidatus Asgardarchaeia archaeon]